MCRPSKNGRARRSAVRKKPPSSGDLCRSSNFRPWFPKCPTGNIGITCKRWSWRELTRLINLMIFLLGASGFVGQSFEKELRHRGWPFTSHSRKRIDYARFEILLKLLRETKPGFLINAAGYTGKPNVDACETARADTLQGNTLLPLTIAHACAAVGVPWGHVSSGCIYAGAGIMENGQRRIEKDLTQPRLKQLAETDPGAIRGYTETDEPNFSFRPPPSSFYTGTKSLSEEAIAIISQSSLWLLRLPLYECEQPRH